MYAQTVAQQNAIKLQQILALQRLRMQRYEEQRQTLLHAMPHPMPHSMSHSMSHSMPQSLHHGLPMAPISSMSPGTITPPAYTTPLTIHDLKPAVLEVFQRLIRDFEEEYQVAYEVGGKFSAETVVTKIYNALLEARIPFGKLVQELPPKGRLEELIRSSLLQRKNEWKESSLKPKSKLEMEMGAETEMGVETRNLGNETAWKDSSDASQDQATKPASETEEGAIHKSSTDLVPPPSETSEEDGSMPVGMKINLNTKRAYREAIAASQLTDQQKSELQRHKASMAQLQRHELQMEKQLNRQRLVLAAARGHPWAKLTLLKEQAASGHVGAQMLLRQRETQMHQQRMEHVQIIQALQAKQEEARALLSSPTLDPVLRSKLVQDLLTRQALMDSETASLSELVSIGGEDFRGIPTRTNAKRSEIEHAIPLSTTTDTATFTRSEIEHGTPLSTTDIAQPIPSTEARQSISDPLQNSSIVKPLDPSVVSTTVETVDDAKYPMIAPKPVFTPGSNFQNESSTGNQDMEVPSKPFSTEDDATKSMIAPKSVLKLGTNCQTESTGNQETDQPPEPSSAGDAAQPLLNSKKRRKSKPKKIPRKLPTNAKESTASDGVKINRELPNEAKEITLLDGTKLKRKLPNKAKGITLSDGTTVKQKLAKTTDQTTISDGEKSKQKLPTDAKETTVLGGTESNQKLPTKANKATTSDDAETIGSAKESVSELPGKDAGDAKELRSELSGKEMNDTEEASSKLPDKRIGDGNEVTLELLGKEIGDAKKVTSVNPEEPNKATSELLDNKFENGDSKNSGSPSPEIEETDILGNREDLAEKSFHEPDSDFENQATDISEYRPRSDSEGSLADTLMTLSPAPSPSRGPTRPPPQANIPKKWNVEDSKLTPAAKRLLKNLAPFNGDGKKTKNECDFDSILGFTASGDDHSDRKQRRSRRMRNPQRNQAPETTVLRTSNRKRKRTVMMGSSSRAPSPLPIDALESFDDLFEMDQTDAAGKKKSISKPEKKSIPEKSKKEKSVLISKMKKLASKWSFLADEKAVEIAHDDSASKKTRKTIDRKRSKLAEEKMSVPTNAGNPPAFMEGKKLSVVTDSGITLATLVNFVPAPKKRKLVSEKNPLETGDAERSSSPAAASASPANKRKKLPRKASVATDAKKTLPSVVSGQRKNRRPSSSSSTESDEALRSDGTIPQFLPPSVQKALKLLAPHNVPGNTTEGDNAFILDAALYSAPSSRSRRKNRQNVSYREL